MGERSTSAPSGHRRRDILLLLVGALAVVGCHGTSHLMTEVASQPVAAVAPSATTARVVFLRSSGFAFAINFVIIDQDGRFLGESVATSQFVAELRPGDYLIIAKGENTALLRARVVAGKVYCVRVVASMGAWRARVNLEPIKGGTGAWAEAQRDMTQTHRLASLGRAGQAEIDAERSEIEERIASAKEDWAALSSSEQIDRTLGPDDGEGPGPAPPTPEPPAPAAVVPDPSPVPASPAPGHDVVVLRNGSRFRGTATTENGATISIVLLDGSARSFRSADVKEVVSAPSPRPAEASKRPLPRGGESEPASPPRAEARAAATREPPPNCNPPYDVDDKNRKVFKPKCYLTPSP
jgi:hypothetical protein